ncbi:actin cortical patch SUR7/pH-response regulator pali [Penicillium verhagenii]|uniref:actin cortical patch SUR7/pH-response regulator pali n=1 Tax=Penicillium verhagenii TaxID=1562060 RepID=UPI0025456259|nr:actin cortical patch SUR7/pH-response regulator pali [Penicillium verhagenii]KAJ5917540.1 actin cortical patch SUR7/pH-response regulator pali [Penicillium verhagenii]
MRMFSGNASRLISISALSLSGAVLVCLSVVFAGCTSPSSPSHLYFLKVNLSNFPEIGDLNLRRSIDLTAVSSSVTDEATSVANSATESLDSAADEASTAVESAATKISTATSGVFSEASDALETLEKQLQSDLPAFYKVGLWGYCEGNDTQVSSCSNPSTSFTFNFSGILNSFSTEIVDLISDIDAEVLTGYRDVSRAIIWLYIFGFIGATLTTLLGIRKVFFHGGNRLLIFLGMISMTLTTAATIGITVIYALITAGIKTILGTFGASASLGSQTLAATWLAVVFSIASLLIWLIELCC